MNYEYFVKTVGGSAFDNLERIGAHLQEALISEENAARLQEGWELWHINTLNDSQGINGLVLVYRRAHS